MFFKVEHYGRYCNEKSPNSPVANIEDCDRTCFDDPKCKWFTYLSNVCKHFEECYQEDRLKDWKYVSTPKHEYFCSENCFATITEGTWSPRQYIRVTKSEEYTYIDIKYDFKFSDEDNCGFMYYEVLDYLSNGYPVEIFNVFEDMGEKKCKEKGDDIK